MIFISFENDTNFMRINNVKFGENNVYLSNRK